MAQCALPSRYRREVTIILVDQAADGHWGVHDNHGLDRRFAERADAMRLANAQCRVHSGSVVLAMPPLCTVNRHAR